MGGNSGTDAITLRLTMATSLRGKFWDDGGRESEPAMPSCFADAL